MRHNMLQQLEALQLENRVGMLYRMGQLLMRTGTEVSLRSRVTKLLKRRQTWLEWRPKTQIWTASEDRLPKGMPPLDYSRTHWAGMRIWTDYSLNWFPHRLPRMTLVSRASIKIEAQEPEIILDHQMHQIAFILRLWAPPHEADLEPGLEQ